MHDDINEHEFFKDGSYFEQLQTKSIFFNHSSFQSVYNFQSTNSIILPSLLITCHSAGFSSTMCHLILREIVDITTDIRFIIICRTWSP